MTIDARQVGVVGLRGIGGAVARRLALTDFQVAGHSPLALPDDHRIALTAAGVRITRLPADAAESAGLVFLDVADDKEREESLFDLGGVADTLPDGGYVVDISRTAPGPAADDTRRLARLGLIRIEAALVGSSPAALRGELSLLLGCADIDAVVLRPVLQALTRDVVHDVKLLGPVGAVAAIHSLAATYAPVYDAARVLVEDERLALSAFRLLGAAPALEWASLQESEQLAS